MMDHILEALDCARRIARQAVRRAAFWAALAAPLLGGASPARGAGSAQLNIGVSIQAITNVFDLNAAPGSSAGTINLSWTEPYHSAGVAPYDYDVRVSSLAQIPDDAAFAAAPPLSTFSPDVPPAPGPGGGAAGFLVSGLTPDVTYYFAIREKDSTSVRGAWLRTTSPPRNLGNYAVATSTRPPPPAGGGATDVAVSSITATWALSAGATSYTFAVSTNAASPPEPVAASSTTALSTAAAEGLSPNTTYFLFVSACNGGCSAFAALGSTITLAASAVGLSTTAVSSSAVSLDWSPNGDPAGTTFLVQQSTDDVAYVTVETTTVVGASIAGLTGGGTYYFRIVAVNGAGIPAAPSNALNVVTPSGPTPSAPGGFAAAAGLRRALLSWDPLPPALQGSGLLHYALRRSTNSGYGYVQIATTTGSAFTDAGLTAWTTYYYRIIARDVAAVDSAPSAPAAATPFTLRPMEPIGVSVGATGATVTLAWSPTGRFADGTPFLSTSTPASDELIGYAVERSTDICAPGYVTVSSLTYATTALVDATGGLNYYYRVFSYNSLGVSTNVLTVSSLGERSFFAEDCGNALTLDAVSAATLNAATNGRGADIRVQRRRRPEDTGGTVFQSVEWRALLDGVTELPGFALPKPARIVLHFDVSGGAVVPSSSPAGGSSVLSAGRPAAASVKDLGMYWYNGGEFKKMYGTVDAAAQTVTVESPNLGLYQIRSLFRADGAVFDLSNVSNRVITPNGDGKNDFVIFTYDPGPRNAAVSGRIYDVTGAFVADMAPGLVPNTLAWNGRAGGRAVAGGVYVYKIEGDGKTYTGTVVVAR